MILIENLMILAINFIYNFILETFDDEAIKYFSTYEAKHLYYN